MSVEPRAEHDPGVTFARLAGAVRAQAVVTTSVDAIVGLAAGDRRPRERGIGPTEVEGGVISTGFLRDITRTRGTQRRFEEAP